MSDYVDYVARKLRAPAFPAVLDGPVVLPGDLFGFQRALVRWALRKGRAAIFADTGLGKTAMQLAWARLVAEAHGRVLILAPLAVAQQTVRESARWGAPASYLRDDDGRSRVVVTNYEMLGRFDPAAFRGVVLAETEGAVLANYRAKERAADAMAQEMIAHVGAAVRAEVTGATARDWNAYEAAQPLRVPGWLKGEAA